MNSGQLIELAIIAFIALGIGVAIWRGGAANPVGTGTLQHKLKNMSHELKVMADGYSRISDGMASLEQGAASSRDIERLRHELEEEKGRTDKVFSSLEILGTDLHAMREQKAVDREVIRQLSESMRTISAQLSEHRDDVNQRLDAMDAMSERIDGNRRAIEAISNRLPGIMETQTAMAEMISATASSVKAMGRQVDRLYDVIVNKGLSQ